MIIYYFMPINFSIYILQNIAQIKSVSAHISSYHFITILIPIYQYLVC